MKEDVLTSRRERGSRRAAIQACQSCMVSVTHIIKTGMGAAGRTSTDFHRFRSISGDKAAINTLDLSRATADVLRLVEQQYRLRFSVFQISGFRSGKTVRRFQRSMPRIDRIFVKFPLIAQPRVAGPDAYRSDFPDRPRSSAIACESLR